MMKMNIVAIDGGLGNQMFQYAYYLKLRANNENTYFLAADNKNNHNGYELGHVFGIKNLKSKNFLLKVIRKTQKPFIHRIQDNDIGNFSETQMGSKPINYHAGYWQSEKYFKNVESKVRSVYDFNESKLNNRSNHALRTITNLETVSIHIRRGDYISNKWVLERLGNVCVKEYYIEAINKMKSMLRDPLNFFIFSDEIVWAKNMLGEENLNFVNWNNGKDSWQDMFLMSRCNHNIIANSSFSWWAAYLNDNPRKIVISPSKWFNTKKGADIILEKWIKI